MSMERSSEGFRALGYLDLVIKQDELLRDLAKRHAGITDIPLTGRLPGETLKLDPSFERKIRTEVLTIGGKSPQELLEALAKRIEVHSGIRSMVESPEFTTLSEPTQIVLAITEAGNLKPMTYSLTTEQIYIAAGEKGLDFLPAEALPHYILQNGDQMTPRTGFIAGMKPIHGRRDIPCVFNLRCTDYGLVLYDQRADPSRLWLSDNQFAFGLRPNTGEVTT